jgi:2-keto-3-deoxy-L-rhamnonate aldolase RhmA
MPEKSMKERLAAGGLVLCMNLRLARSVDIAMVAKAGGYDALYVDMQHAPYSIETTATICAAALGIGITPLVRVPSHDPQWMSRVLDGGAQGVILPDVNTSAQAEAIVSACRFPPLGKRSVMGLGLALGLPLGAAIRAEPKAQRGDGGHRHARDQGGYRELRGHRRSRWGRCPIDRFR